MAKQSKKELSGTQKVGLGVGLTAAAVAAAGAYFLYGSKDAVKNRKKVKSWALKAKAEVLEGLEKAEHITEAEYKTLVNAATGIYGTVQSATKGEVQDFKKEMNDHWNKIKKSGVVEKIVRKVSTASPRPKKAGKKAQKAPVKTAPTKGAAKKSTPKK